jgi:hypothetical protein
MSTSSESNTIPQLIIEKGIPVPERSSLPHIPLEDMAVGDSVLVPVTKEKEVDALRQRVCRYQTKNENAKFRVMKDDSGEGMRVYRI